MNFDAIYDDLYKVLTHPIPYEDRLISIIDNTGKESLIYSFADICHDTHTIKIQSVEQLSPDLYGLCSEIKNLYNHNGPITCHAFISNTTSSSFKNHIDYDDVYILCIRGKKEYNVDGNIISLTPGRHIYIKAGTFHFSTKSLTNDTVVLSFGFHKFLIDKVLL